MSRTNIELDEALVHEVMHRNGLRGIGWDGDLDELRPSMGSPRRRVERPAGVRQG